MRKRATLVPGMIIGGRYFGRGGALVVEILVRLGIEHVFSIPGAQTLSIWDGMYRRKDLHLVYPGSEWNAVYMAMDYACQMNKPAVVLNTVGPGCVNELPAMATAFKRNVPVLFITPGQPAYKRERIDTVFQGLRQTEILRPFCHREYRITEATPNWGSILRLAHEYVCTGQVVRVEIEFPLLFQLRTERIIRTL